MLTRRELLRWTSVGAAILGGLAVRRRAQAATPKPNTVLWQRELPVRYQADVAVIGAGIAGTCAALAAAREGARVTLVEHFAVPGGNATVGGVASFCGETAGQGEVFDRIIAEMQRYAAIDAYQPYPQADNRKFDHEILAVVLQELLVRAGVRPLLHTRLIDARVEDGRISEAVVSGPSGPEAIRAAQFIDCTGEAHLTHQAGFPTLKGREGDSLQLPMSLMFFVRHVGPEHARVQAPEGAFEKFLTADELPMTSVWPAGPGANAIKIKTPMFDAADTVSLTDAEIHGRRRMMAVLDYYQRVERQPWLLDHCAARIGIREGRRILGRYVLTLDDLRAGRSFDDAVARGVYVLDAQKLDDDKRTYVLPPEQRSVPPYHVPFRSLVVSGARNLLAAGRCLSADQLALSSARVMTTCAMMGQAAGTAAAMAADRGADVCDMDGVEVRQRLEALGANLAL